MKKIKFKNYIYKTKIHEYNIKKQEFVNRQTHKFSH